MTALPSTLGLPVASPGELPKIQAGKLTADLDLTSEELRRLLDVSADVKRHPRQYAPRSRDGT